MRLKCFKLDDYGLACIPELMDLLAKMLKINPKERITPKEILNHIFC